MRKDSEKRMVLNSGRGNRLLGNNLLGNMLLRNWVLAVIDDAEGVAMIGQDHAPFEKGRSISRQPGMVCSREGDAA